MVWYITLFFILCTVAICAGALLVWIDGTPVDRSEDGRDAEERVASIRGTLE